VKVNEYFQKLEKNPDLTKTENGYKENVNFKKFENDLKNANNNIEEKNKEIEKLKTELAKEKQKGFFKRLFS
jgi:flagellar hook-basal body complex protein FliE